MTRLRNILGVVLLVSAATCGGEAPRSYDESSGNLTTANIEVRLRGDDAGSYTSVTAKAAAIGVWADGTAIPVTPTGFTANLANTDQAWLLGTFALPTSASHVRIVLRLQDSGTWNTGSSSGSVDYKGAPIELNVPAANLLARDKVVIHADLARSLVWVNDTLIFLEQGVVRF